MTSYPSYGNPVWPAAMQPHYHGAHQPHHEGFCPACCHPMSQCCCGWRECRCESKELLASPGKRAAGDIRKVPGRATEPESMAADIPPSMAAAFTGVAGLNQ